MNYITAATAQTFITLFCSLLFTCISIFSYRRAECEKNILTNIWFTVATSLGFATFVTGYVLTMAVLATDLTEITTSIEIIWFILLTLCLFQFTSFLNAWLINTFYVCKYSSANNLVTNMNQDIEVCFSWKKILITFCGWIVISIIVSGIALIISAAIGQ